MATFYKAPTENYVSTTLNGSINDTVDTITVNSATKLQAPGVIVIDREDGNGTATPSAREVISFTGIAGNDLTGCTRGAEGSTGRSHNDGALVEAVLTAGMWDDLADGVIAALGNDATGAKLTVSNATISQVTQTTRLAVSSIASIASLKTTVLDITNIAVSSIASVPVIRVGDITNLHSSSTASIAFGAITQLSTSSVATVATLYITKNVNASGASIVGIPRTYVGYFTRTNTDGDGDQAVTGIGFKPKAVEIFATVSGTKTWSKGRTDGTTQTCLRMSLAGDATAVNTDRYVAIENSTGAYNSASHKSFDNDGFTVTWGKSGSPAGTTTCHYIAIG